MAGKTTIGPTIKVDGEQVFKQQISSINTSLKTMGAEMKLITAEYELNDQAVYSLTQRQEVLLETIAKQSEKVNVLDQALESSIQKYGATSEQAERWRQSLYNAQAELAKTEKALQNNDKELEEAQKAMDGFGESTNDTTGFLNGIVGQLGQLAESVGIKLPSQLTNLTKGFGDTASGGADLGQTVQGLTKGLGVDLPPSITDAVSGLGGLSAATLAAAAGFVAALKALVEFSVAGAKMADDLATNATIMGVTNEKYQEFAYMADLVDTSTETIGSSMARLTRSMSDAQYGTEKTQQAFAKLGISYEDTNGRLRDSEAVFYEAIDALGKMENQTERDAIAMDLMGRSARDLNPLIAAGGKNMKELANEAHNVGYVMSNEMLESYLALSDEMDRFTQISQGLKNNLGDIVTPMLTSTMEKINEIVGDISDKIQNSQATEFLSTSFGLVGNLVEILGDRLMPILDGIFEYTDKLYAGVNLVAEPIGWLGERVSDLSGNVSKFLKGDEVDWNDFAKRANDSAVEVMDSWDKSINTLIGKNKELQDSADETGAAVGESLAQGLASGVSAAEREYGTFNELTQKVKEANKQLAEETKRAAASNYTTMEDSRGRLMVVHRNEIELYERHSRYIEEHYAHLSDAQKISLAKQLDQQQSATQKMDNTMQRATATAASNGKKDGEKWGESITDGISAGLSRGIPKVDSSMRDVVSTIEKAITEGLDIHSPSRKGTGWGANTIQGYINGVTTMMAPLRQSIGGALGVIGGLSAAPNVRLSNAALAGAGLSPLPMAAGYGSGSVSTVNHNRAGDNYSNSINVDARNIHELNDMMRIATNAQRTRRSGKFRRR